jgi:hypothetical protein
MLRIFIFVIFVTFRFYHILQLTHKPCRLEMGISLIEKKPGLFYTHTNNDERH